MPVETSACLSPGTVMGRVTAGTAVMRPDVSAGGEGRWLQRGACRFLRLGVGTQLSEQMLQDLKSIPLPGWRHPDCTHGREPCCGRDVWWGVGSGGVV